MIFLALTKSTEALLKSEMSTTQLTSSHAANKKKILQNSGIQRVVEKRKISALNPFVNPTFPSLTILLENNNNVQKIKTVVM